MKTYTILKGRETQIIVLIIKRFPIRQSLIIDFLGGLKYVL